MRRLTGGTRPIEGNTSWPASNEIAGAFLASSVVHLLLLIPTLMKEQIYDRVLSSRSGETLVMLYDYTQAGNVQVQHQLAWLMDFLGEFHAVIRRLYRCRLAR